MSENENAHSRDAFSDERVEKLLTSIDDVDRKRVQPPPHIWDSISANLSQAPHGSASAVGSNSDSSNSVGVVGIDPAAQDVSTTTSWSSNVTSNLMIAAAATIVVIIGGILIYRNSQPPANTIVASAQLMYQADVFDPLGENASAHVELIKRDDKLVIDVDEASLPNSNREELDLELWLIAPDSDGNVADLVSLGTFSSPNVHEFAVPKDYDTNVFSVVDISVEPRDGNNDHSGRSILRGALEA